MSSILQKDTEIHFPHFTVLKASAGSGKTHTLTKRFVQFLLSEKIGKNELRNVLAITFSNNAAKEMKERILQWLKDVCNGDDEKTAELLKVLALDGGKLREKAELLIDEILDNYSDFQVKTIDSFMTSVFKSSAIDFGYNPDFEILLSGEQLMRYAFDLYLRDVKEGTSQARLLDEIVFVIAGMKKRSAAYLWDPSSVLLEEMKNIYGKLAATGKRPLIEDLSVDSIEIRTTIRNKAEDIEGLIEKSGLERNGSSGFKTILPLVRGGKFADLVDCGLRTPPVKKIAKKDDALAEKYALILDMWKELGLLIDRMISIQVLSFYSPYLRLYEEFGDTIEKIKKRQGKVFIEDVNRYLAEYLTAMIVPDIYFRLGERIFHFLIDEFQDTAPVQWKNLVPLIEESLSKDGSAFVVGDTKQAIYGFRNADYKIMKSLEQKGQNPFPSAEHDVQELPTNWRSLEGVVAFSRKVFREIVAGNEKYSRAGEESGLTDYQQEVKDGNERKGLAEVILLDKDEEDPPERLKIQELVTGLCLRGYRYSDIAVLTQRNEDAVRATIWLNEKDVPFISFSSLDIRRRKITGEIVALLQFLDSPTDDLSFAVFLMGGLFRRNLEGEYPDVDRDRLREFLFTHRDGHSHRRPLYKAFQQEFAQLWERCFAGLFRASGYFPLYDLVSELFGIFRAFELMPDEEATLVKILDVVKEFEGKGYNSIKDFLEFADDGNAGESVWNMDVPKSENAVKVMTIHKAKGLGFPVVIVLLYEDQTRGFDHILKEEGDRIRLLRITQKSRQCDPEFERLYGEEKLKETVARLNSLYVGFTRPEEELYVVGMRGKKGSDSYPFCLLPADEFPSLIEKPRRQAPVSEEKGDGFNVVHRDDRLKLQSTTEEMIGHEERQRGEFIHRVLSKIDYYEGGKDEIIPAVINRLQEESGTCCRPDEIKDLIVKLLSGREMRFYFEQQPGRKIMNEQEFSDASGRLFRMDRVVVDADKVTVIDYKTGADVSAEDKTDKDTYSSQVMNYVKILGSIFPDKAIGGIIAFIDTGAIRKIV